MTAHGHSTHRTHPDRRRPRVPRSARRRAAAPGTRSLGRGITDDATDETHTRSAVRRLSPKLRTASAARRSARRVVLSALSAESEHRPATSPLFGSEHSQNARKALRDAAASPFKAAAGATVTAAGLIRLRALAVAVVMLPPIRCPCCSRAAASPRRLELDTIKVALQRFCDSPSAG